MKKGFTLIELLVVVLIIGILSAVALPQYTKTVEKSRASEAVTLLGTIANGERIYKMANGSYTDVLDDLDVTVSTTTKNFIFTPTVSSGTLKVQADRANNGTAVSGTNAYALVLHMDSDGTITRNCCGSEEMCKAVKSGNDWTYEGQCNAASNGSGNGGGSSHSGGGSGGGGGSFGGHSGGS